MRWLFLLTCLISFSSIEAAAQSEKLLTLTIESETNQKIADLKSLLIHPKKCPRFDVPYVFAGGSGMLFVMGAPRIATFDA